jgi:hypothetical protein
MRLLTKGEALNYACRVLSLDHGFFRIAGKHSTSLYYTRRGTSHKIRISDHVDPFRNDDVRAEVIIGDSTIEADVKYRVAKAVAEFAVRDRNRVTR